MCNDEPVDRAVTKGSGTGSSRRGLVERRMLNFAPRGFFAVTRSS